jgi:DNA-binding transcriptional LysR family regulator
MDLGDLKIFRAVVEEGGISRAAARLHRVQSNVTTRIKQLEANLGTELFIREGKRLHLSPAGRVLLDYAERLLALADEAVCAVQDDERPRGAFRLGAMESTAAVRLPAPLSEFYRRFPEVDLRLQTGNPTQLAAAILNDELDAAFVAEPVSEQHFEHFQAFEEELVLVSKRDHPPIRPGSALPPTIIAFEHGCPHRKRIEAWYESCGELPRHTIELTSYHAMLGCVVVGMGVALLPKSVLGTFPERHRIREHTLPPGRDKATTLLIWRRRAGSPKIEALKAVLCDTAG